MLRGDEAYGGGGSSRGSPPRRSRSLSLPLSRSRSFPPKTRRSQRRNGLTRVSSGAGLLSSLAFAAASSDGDAVTGSPPAAATCRLSIQLRWRLHSPVGTPPSLK